MVIKGDTMTAETLFEKAAEEARIRCPNSVAVQLGISVAERLKRHCEVPVNTTLLAAQLLIPLCTENRKWLLEFQREQLANSSSLSAITRKYG